MTLRLDIPHDPPSERKIARAVDIIHGGGVAAYPTDSVYALGCAIDARKAVETIRRVKRMSESQRLALILPDVSRASEYAHFSRAAFRLAKRIFPGPYTLVLPATREVPRLLLDKRARTVGIRIPAHPVPRALVERLGRPLLTTSAIPPDDGEPLQYLDDLIDAFGKHLDVAIDAGPCGIEPTTVLEIDEDETITIIRPGLGPTDDLTA
jgi:tRNA threonylcarbamoyl adenosine modification protein (Sua5/YciO/YrdC/YwlC family)